jgi:hypothetical protein
MTSNPSIIWTTRDWTEAIARLLVSGALPCRTVLVPRTASPTRSAGSCCSLVSSQQWPPPSTSSSRQMWTSLPGRKSCGRARLLALFRQNVALIHFWLGADSGLIGPRTRKALRSSARRAVEESTRWTSLWLEPLCGHSMAALTKLWRWRRAPRIFVTDSPNSVTNVLLQAVRNRTAIGIVYHGGSTPGAQRLVHPVAVFRLPGSDKEFVEAYCALRGATRTFRIDLVRIAHLSGGIQLTTSGTGSERSRQPPSWTTLLIVVGLFIVAVMFLSSGILMWRQ